MTTDAQFLRAIGIAPSAADHIVETQGGRGSGKQLAMARWIARQRAMGETVTVFGPSMAVTWLEKWLALNDGDSTKG